ncbi:ABC transporter ATP-binding protein [Labrys wisconsinensis]|uniref:Branched-chain amino acid transport system ATP-binding protein n=1 Tax=Labrys wisconsinensis TaxID=425677 RepID=A0ABU0J6Y1_9HYPH|nr:ABC transporter ATP-binding protein [Labrys wisconsinensis]MDQ0470013.1 branched-chain amino acid transport system ATP-binding protein [Labrys wisconsinensis]
MGPDIVLGADRIVTRYGATQALHGVSLSVERGQIVALLGANGAGKSTTLRTLSGLVAASSGSVRFLGEDITRLPAHHLPHRGLVHVPEGRRIFGDMTIKENLDLGSFTLADDVERRRRLDHVFELFPILAHRRNGDARNLSGGEQQMLAIGRALMAAPKVLLLDEPSMGLAPQLIKDVMTIVQRLNREGVTILLVEQNSKVALKFADYGYVLKAGRIVLEGSGSDLANNESVINAYLGGAAA